ncbi:MAG: hypothetical protein ACSHXJ_05655 [Marinomonas colpomeniae]
MSNNQQLIARSPEEEKRSTEIFDSYRDELYKRQLSNTEAYDKAILSLSSAGLAMSLAFIRFVIPLEEAKHLLVLKLSWGFFLLSIVVILISFLISNKGISIQLKHAEQYYIKNEQEAFNKFNIYEYINSRLNYLSGALFIIALAFIVGFVIFNLEK